MTGPLKDGWSDVDLPAGDRSTGLEATGVHAGACNGDDAGADSARPDAPPAAEPAPAPRSVAARLALRRRSDWLLAAVDVTSTVVVLLAVQDMLHRAMTLSRAWYAVLAVAVVLAGRSAGLYRRAALRPGTPLASQAALTGAATGALALLAVAVSPPGPGLAWAALVALGVGTAGLASRAALARARRALVPFGRGLERYAVLGDSPQMRRLAADLTRAAAAPFTLVGTVPEGLGAADCASAVARLRVDGLLVPAHLRPLEVAALARELAGFDVDVLMAPRPGDLDAQVTAATHLQGVPLLRLGGAAPRRRAIRGKARADRGRGVAILGTRGVPAAYGGFETFAEQLGTRLAAAGTPVTVYCRSHFATGATEYAGMRLVTLPTLRHKYLDTVVHTAVSAAHLVATGGPRVVLVCNAANAPVVPLLRLAGRRVVLNVDGLEWRRGKWGVLGRSWYRMGEWLAVRTASVLVTDAEEVRTYYRVRHDSDSVMVPYGAAQLPRGAGDLPGDLPVVTDGYALYVSRFERENNPELVARAHAAADCSLGLVMLGQAAYDRALEARVRAVAAPGAVLPGARYGADYTGLLTHAGVYVHATEVGGTHPALIEAMGAGNLCLVLDTPENREVAGDVAWYFHDEASLAGLLRRAGMLGGDALTAVRAATTASAAARYSWDAVAQRYDALLFGASSHQPLAPMVRS